MTNIKLQKKITNFKDINIAKNLDFELSNYTKVINRYYQLVSCEELSEFEIKSLDKILEQAENDEILCFFLNEVDEITFAELCFYEKDNLEKYNNKKNNFKKYIKQISELNNVRNFLSASNLKREDNFMKKYSFIFWTIVTFLIIIFGVGYEFNRKKNVTAKINPKDSIADNNTTINSYHSKKLGFAEADFNQAIQLHPKDSFDYGNSSFLYSDKAKRNLSGFYNNLGLYYYFRGQRNLAKDSFQKALEIDPELASAKSNLEHI